MRSLPPDVVPYKRTAEFTADSVPAGLLRGHRTKAGAWGRIVVLEGSLLYRILEPALEEIEVGPETPGVIEPTIEHEVVPRPGVRFYVEFHHVPAPGEAPLPDAAASDPRTEWAKR